MKLRAWIPRLSISMRLALWYGLSLLILLSVFVVYLYTSFHVGLHQDFERQLRAEGEAIRQRLNDGAFVSAKVVQLAEPLQVGYGTFARVVSPDGRVLERSPSFADRSPFSPRVPDGAEPIVRSHTWSGDLARTLYLPLDEASTSSRTTAWLEVTRLESSIHREMHRLGWLLGIGIAIGVVVAIGSGYGLARRALHPVAALTEAARDIQEEPAGELPTDFGVRDELTDLAETFNAMLMRIRSGFERERRFRADAAHKMFTPLTAMQSELDVALRKPRSEDEYRDTLQTMRQHTETLTAMLDELMALSEAEAISGADTADPVDLSARIDTCVRRFRARAQRRHIDLEYRGSDEVWVMAQGEHVDTLAINLIENALKYTPDGGHVRVTVQAEGDVAELRVADDGMGFDPQEANRLFDRFYRTADADATAPGSGLGLSIVKAIAEGYEGAVAAKSSGTGEGGTFIVHLPSVGPSS
mgnify:CR=1 FL=1